MELDRALDCSSVPTRSTIGSLCVQFVCSGNGFVLLLNELMNYSDLIQSIRERFKFSSNDSFHLEYSSPACSSVYLDNESDFKMLFCCAKIYHMDNVLVTVVKDVGKSCSSTSVVVDDCAEMIDENDYLGDAFKDGPQKFFLSDEWGSYLSHAGQKFESIADFRDKLRKFAVQSGFHYVLSRNDSIYVNAVCANRDVDHCGWEVLGSVASINQCFYITRFNNVHTCRGMIRNRSHRQLGSKIVRTCIESTVCLNLGLKPREIMSNFKSTYGYEISYKVASRAKKRCVEKMYGSECDSFSMLSWFREAVLETNPGSSVVLEVDESTERFKRVFVSYAGQIQGFKFSLPVLYVDGAFGKSKYKGQILAATGRNGNKGENNIGMDDFERYIPFTTYVKNGDWDKANECLRELDDPCGAVTAVDPRDNYRDTALHVAAREGHLNVIRGLILLLKMRREDLELKTAQDFTAYGSGITLGVTEEFLMERAKYMAEQYEKTHGIFLERQNSEGCTALYLAVRVGNVGIVKELAHMMTQEGLELKSFSGSSALHQAVGYERIDIVQVLVPLMRKEGLEIKDDDGGTPLNYAVLKGNADIVKALVQSMRQEGLEIRNSKAEIALPRAISKGHMHIVRELLPLMRTEAFEEKDGRGFTALCWAIACLKDGEVYEIAKYMAERNDRVFGIPSAPYDEIPVVQALRWRKWRLACSIYSLTPLELIDQPNGGAFICYCLDTSTQIGKTVNFSNHFN